MTLAQRRRCNGESSLNNKEKLQQSYSNQVVPITVIDSISLPIASSDSSSTLTKEAPPMPTPKVTATTSNRSCTSSTGDLSTVNLDITGLGKISFTSNNPEASIARLIKELKQQGSL